MLFNFKSTAALALFLARALAAPTEIPVQEGDLIVTDTRVLDNGAVVTIWNSVEPSNSTSTEAAPTMNRRCGSNTAVRFNDNVPSREAGSSLLDLLRGPSSNLLASSPRSICITVSGSRACASWATHVGEIHSSDLLNGAGVVFWTCGYVGRSGKAHDVSLGYGCTTQCYSNRPDGCVA
ncbi:hypothetical protein B0T22DRAFT_510650 [Podospora appendiculata]|uniref:WD-like domain-containing protein n=1 Tax=Podospora appendiculata TaxID=314037 RepID=A0AAE0X829_9PEZI|nr:hypothetical protein B0T22DRAFT_510650 [Podospora appendiculata]